MRAIALGLVGILIFSGSMPATRVAVEQLDGVLMGVGRAVVAAVLAAALLALTHSARPDRRQVRRLAIVALGVVVGFPLLTALALRDLTSAHSAVIVGLLPAATAVLAVARAGERPSRRFWLASGAGLVAVLVFAFVQGAGAPSPADGLLLVAVALCGLGYAEGGALARELGGWRTICWALLVALPVTVPVTLAACLTGDVEGSAAAWAGFAYTCVGSMFLGFFAWYAALALGGVAKIGQVQLLQPLITLGLSALLLGEEITAAMLIAAVAVLACVAGTQRARVSLAAVTDEERSRGVGPASAAVTP